MEIGHVSTLSLIGMGIQILVGVCGPIALFVFSIKKFKVKGSTFWYGAGMFLAAVFLLESLFNSFIINGLGETLTGNIFLYAIYGGVVAAVFEETSRALAFRYLIRDRLNMPNAVSYGFGHAGMEAFVIIGINGINLLITSVLVNNGTFESSLALMEAADKTAMIESASTLWLSNPMLFYAGSIERLFAFVLQVSLTVIVYKSVKDNKTEILGKAMLIHFAVNFVSVLLSEYLPVVVTEIVVALMSLGVAYYAYRISDKDDLETLKQ